MAEIKLEQLTKVYPDGTKAVDALDLEIADGEFVVLVGPSGCGKTSALRMVAGLEDITDGKVWIGDRVVNRVSPKDRDIAMIFQNYALYPHMTAARNMGFALRMRKVPTGQIRTRVNEAAGVLGLMQALDKRPRTLSGGQRQRVAMGRAIVREPQAFLMDEPLSNLDAKLRVEMRAEIARLQRDLGVTTIYVTHDQTEAMTLGDRVAVMRDGVLQQMAAPHELYRRPRNLFVAEFIGSPSMNLVGADLQRSNGSLVATFGDCRLALNESESLAPFVGKRLILGIRPEHIEDASIASEAPRDCRLAAVVDIREDLGSDLYVHFSVAGPPVLGEDVRAAVGDDAVEATEAQTKHQSSLWVARVGDASRALEGEPIELVVDTSRLQFFDPATGDGIYADRDVKASPVS
jgi:multiple sugar transport system ATP-binding protein